MSIDITLAGSEYEWTKALWDGRVRPEGVNLTTVDFKPHPRRFTRMIDGLEFDACELSMGSYLATLASDEEYPFTALPIFPWRRFRHSYMYKRRGAGIEELADLEGRDVGIVNWQTTTGVWQRGVARERHGLDTTSVNWHAAGSEIVELGEFEDYDITYIEKSGSRHQLEHMLETGQLDAVFHPVRLRADNGERIFEDPLATEEEYYRETSIFPIMHAVVVKDEVLEAHPWIAQKLFDAFQEAKELLLDDLEKTGWLPLVWSGLHLERQQELFGEDPWEYGLTEDNRIALETFLSYAANQELIPEPYDVEEIFATDHLNTGRFG